MNKNEMQLINAIIKKTDILSARLDGFDKLINVLIEKTDINNDFISSTSDILKTLMLDYNNYLDEFNKLKNNIIRKEMNVDYN